MIEIAAVIWCACGWLSWMRIIRQMARELDGRRLLRNENVPLAILVLLGMLMLGPAANIKAVQ